MKAYKFRQPGLDRTERVLDTIENLSSALLPWLLLAFVVMMLAQCWGA